MRRFVEDESRFGLHPGHPRRRLTARGAKPHQSIRPRYHYTWFYAAVEPTTGDSLVLEFPGLDAACVQAFLDEFAQRYPDTMNVLLWDGAPAHIARSLTLPENVMVLRLPAYCPELNSIERLWQDLRARIGDALHADLDALRAHVAEMLRAYTPEALASLCGYPYLREASLALQS